MRVRTHVWIGVMTLAALTALAGSASAESTAVIGTAPTGSAIWDGSGNAYIFGAGGVISKYNATTNVATTTSASLPNALAGAAPVWDPSAHVAYLFGGSINGSNACADFTTTILRYDPATNTVAQMPTQLPLKLSRTSVVWNEAGSAFLLGGMDGYCGEVRSVYKYTPATGAIVQMADVPTFFQWGSSVWHAPSSSIYVFAPYTSSGQTTKILKFNVSTNTSSYWTSELPTARRNANVVFNGSTAYVMGGYDQNASNAQGTNVYLNDVLKVSLSTGSVAQAPVTLPYAACCGGAVWNGVSSAFTFGGYPRPNDIVRYSTAAQTPPTQPRNVTTWIGAAANGAPRVSVNWTTPMAPGTSSVTSYTVYRGTTAGQATLIGTVSAAGPLTYLDPSVVNGTTYYYSVGAVSAVGEGIRSSEANASIVSAPPVPVLGNIDNYIEGQFLVWSPTGTGGSPILNYTIYRGTSSGGATSYRQVGNVTSFSDRGGNVTVGTLYCYQISATNALGTSPRSNELCTTTWGHARVANLTATSGLSATEITLTWQTVQGYPAVQSINIYRRDGSEPQTLLVTLGPSATSFTDRTGTMGHPWYYNVSAVNTAFGDTGPKMFAWGVSLCANSHDCFASPVNIGTQRPTSFWLDNGGAGSEYGEPIGQCSGGNVFTAWARFTAQTGGRAVIQQIGGDAIAPRLAAYTGSRVDALARVACMSSDPGGAFLAFDCVAGATYHIQMSGGTRRGGATFRIEGCGETFSGVSTNPDQPSVQDHRVVSTPNSCAGGVCSGVSVESDQRVAADTSLDDPDRVSAQSAEGSQEQAYASSEASVTSANCGGPLQPACPLGTDQTRVAVGIVEDPVPGCGFNCDPGELIAYVEKMMERAREMAEEPPVKVQHR